MWLTICLGASGVLGHFFSSFSVSESPGGLQKQIAKHTPRVSNSADVGWVLIARIFNKILGNAVAAGPEITY